MGNRFVVLSILTGLFQLICVIALLLGLLAIFNGGTSAGNPNDPFSQLPAGMRAIGGSVLALYGLTGLVFSGGISVLISIDESTHALQQQLPAVIAALERTIAKVQPAGSVEQPIPTTAPVVSEYRTAPVEHLDEPTTSQCPNCGTQNDPDGRFCENCGTSLPRS
jgi:hypothetical protein